MNDLAPVRRRDEEATLPREVYFSDAYFSKQQLSSLCQQLIEVRRTRCESLLEIGKGNGFVSEFLCQSGVDVTTIDVNAALQPDIVGGVEELDAIFGAKKFDCVLCAEVLEHLRFDVFEESIRQLRDRTRRYCIITLPRCDHIHHHFLVRFALPFLGSRSAHFTFPHLRKSKPEIYDGHYWEVNSEEYCSLTNIRETMRKYFRVVEDYRFDENSYHQFFVLQV